MRSIRRNNIKLAYRSLRSSKGRSFLTMLGIIIGVMAVVLMVCIGQGIKQQISGHLGGNTKNVLSVQPGSDDSASSSLLGGLSSASSGLLTGNDLRTVQKTAGVEYAVPLSTASGSMSGDHTVTSPFIVATTGDFPQVMKQSFASGGFFNPDVDTKTIVLGETIAQKLFDDNAPLGQTLTWRGEQFIVAGVFDNFNAPPFSLEANFNNAVFVPFSVAQRLSGNVLGIYQIVAKTSASSDTDGVVQAVRSALYAAHGGAHDVTVGRTTGTNVASDQTIHLVTVLVMGAALIALITGSVGIMNIMLVSVTERMHEIGLRKAIGATNRQIMRQFVAEAFVLSAVGAAVGVILACAAVGLLRAFTTLQAVLVWQVMVIAPLVAIFIGVLFGSIPALQAARKDPIEALRHE